MRLSQGPPIYFLITYPSMLSRASSIDMVNLKNTSILETTPGTLSS